jgi:hypothetical protein
MNPDITEDFKFINFDDLEILFADHLESTGCYEKV